MASCGSGGTSETRHVGAHRALRQGEPAQQAFEDGARLLVARLHILPRQLEPAGHLVDEVAVYEVCCEAVGQQSAHFGTTRARLTGDCHDWNPRSLLAATLQRGAGSRTIRA